MAAGAAGAAPGPERMAALRERVVADPYDARAWDELLGEVEKRARSPEGHAELRAVYEDALRAFPTSVRVR